MKHLILPLLLLITLESHALEPLRFTLPDQGKYPVIKIYDGDTFTILIPPNHTVNIRISGIDAPERTQEFGLYARALLINLIGNEPVIIYPITLDKWGRTIAKCFNSDGKDIALEILKLGMAWHYAEYDDTPEYIDAEMEARHTQTGLWSRPNPMPPQDYRSAPRNIKRKNQ